MIKTARSLPSSTPLLRSLAPRPRLSARVHCLQRRASPVQRRSFFDDGQSSSHRAVENININRMRNESYDYYVRRRNFLLCGAVAGTIAACYTAYLLFVAIRKPKKLDSGRPDKADPFTTDAGSRRKTVLHDAEGREIVPTGNSVVPTFPRTLNMTAASEVGQGAADDIGYTLVGLGVRTVTFIGIQVYMVGYYIATQDIAAIQSRLIKEINPIATTLVPSEKEALRQALLDPVQGEKLWNAVLQEIRPRSIFRIVPVRDTDFHHMRDGFVRAITARSQVNHAEFGDEAFGTVMREFKSLFNRGKVPKGWEMLLCRDSDGHLTVAYDNGQTGVSTIGRVVDERVSRLLWLNYLAGKQVASEPARKNIVEGIMEFVERPIGTVAAQVV
ncbi:chalcone-flavanone isomerase [Xylaria intraflava]|nr:chalcone-flavanone isomerase [Xylaria intraflava]